MALAPGHVTRPGARRDVGAGVEFRILGPLEVVHEGEPVALPRGRARALLALLVLRAGSAVAGDRLVDELWGPRPPPTATKSLHNLVSDLRRRLAPGGDGDHGPIATTGSAYALRVSADDIDALRFGSLVAASASRPDRERADLLHAALGLWRGPALADFAYEPFAQTAIATLEEQRLAALEQRVDADLALGRHAGLVAELHTLVAEHPYREGLRAQLMLALYRSGRQVDALAAFQDARRTLVEDLGVEPGPALARLERAVLAQDPELEAGEAALAAPARAGWGRTPPDGSAPAGGALPWLGAERRTVTVVCAEVAVPAAAGHLDPEALGSRLKGAVERAHTIVADHGGAVESVAGGTVVALFGVPAAHEDDAARAVRAALGIGAAAAGGGLVARAGVSTGEVVVQDADDGPVVVPGEVVALAQRLQHAAADGHVLVGEATRRLLGDGARVEATASLVLDRRGRPATVWRVVDLISGDGGDGGGGGVAARLQPHGRHRLVGRERELTQLHAALRGVRRTGTAARLTVVGEAGVGKSALVGAFSAAVAGEATVLACRCPAYGEGITYWPLRALVLGATGGRGPGALRGLLAGHGDAGEIAGQLAAAAGWRGGPSGGREGFAAARRLLEVLALRAPVVVVVDDAHWAQPAFLDLVEHLGEAVAGPALLVCAARPELAERRPAWVSAEAATLPLGPLAPADCDRLVGDLLAGRNRLDDDRVAEIVRMAGGNPLFIEQLLAGARHDGEIGVPPSVRALLAARLDRLGPAERDLLRSASVVGEEVPLDLLRALVPAHAHPHLGAHLEALAAWELVGPGRQEGPGEGEGFAFRHALVRQVAYGATTREVRADLHERVAAWLEEQEPAGMHELAGHHLEQACGHRRVLGLAGERTATLARRAGEHLAEAGFEASERFDMAAAGDFLGRARSLLPTGHPARHGVLRRLAEAYPTLGRLDDADGVLAELDDDPRLRDDPAARARLRLEQLRVRLIAGPDPARHRDLRAEVDAAVRVLDPLGDHSGLSQACYLLAIMHQRAGEVAELAAVAARGLAHARRSGEVREILGALWFPTWALVDGPAPVTEAVAGCEALLGEGPGPHVAVMTDLARLSAMLGDFDRARDLVAMAWREARERARVRRPLAVLAQRAAEVELAAGDPGAAERLLRQALGIALGVGERDSAAQAAAELSCLVATRGERGEAATLAALAGEQAPAESVGAQASWRRAAARVALGREPGGGGAGPVELVEEAIALVPAGRLSLRATLHLDLAAALSAGGDPAGAARAAEQAADLHQRKGNLVAARSARPGS